MRPEFIFFFRHNGQLIIFNMGIRRGEKLNCLGTSLPTPSLECLFTSEEGEGSPASPSLREIFPARNERKISELLAKQHLQRGDPRCKSFSSDKGTSDCVERDVLK